MSYVDPQIQYRFESLSIDLKNAILEKNVKLNTLDDLNRALKEITVGEYSSSDTAPHPGR